MGSRSCALQFSQYVRVYGIKFRDWQSVDWFTCRTIALRVEHRRFRLLRSNEVFVSE